MNNWRYLRKTCREVVYMNWITVFGKQTVSHLMTGMLKNLEKLWSGNGMFNIKIAIIVLHTIETTFNILRF